MQTPYPAESAAQFIPPPSTHPPLLSEFNCKKRVPFTFFLPTFKLKNFINRILFLNLTFPPPFTPTYSPTPIPPAPSTPPYNREMISNSSCSNPSQWYKRLAPQSTSLIGDCHTNGNTPLCVSYVLQKQETFGSIFVNRLKLIQPGKGSNILLFTIKGSYLKFIHPTKGPNLLSPKYSLFLK